MRNKLKISLHEHYSLAIFLDNFFIIFFTSVEEYPRNEIIRAKFKCKVQVCFQTQKVQTGNFLQKKKKKKLPTFTCVSKVQNEIYFENILIQELKL